MPGHLFLTVERTRNIKVKILVAWMKKFAFVSASQIEQAPARGERSGSRHPADPGLRHFRICRTLGMGR